MSNKMKPRARFLLANGLHQGKRYASIASIALVALVPYEIAREIS